MPCSVSVNIVLGVSWQGNTYIDRALPFGLRSVPNIFNAVAEFLAWVLYCEGVSALIHYLDDFLLFESSGLNIAAVARALVEEIFSCIGAPLAHNKTEGPSTVLTFLGIRLDTDQLQLSLPADKVTRLRDLLYQWKLKKSCTREQLESLLGHLSHAATVVCPGRIFLRNLFSMLSKPYHLIRLGMEA